MKGIFETKIMFVVILLYFKLYSARMSGMRMRSLEYSKCSPNAAYPVSTENVVIEIGANTNFLLSGSFATSVNLTSPITANVLLKRKFVVWIEVPCKKNVGSCTYTDLCSFGYPANAECPSRLKNNNIPCRCPIPQGNYTLPKHINMFLNKPIWVGKYKGNIQVISSKQLLVCYNFNFELYNGDNEV